MIEPISYRDLPQAPALFRDYVTASPRALELVDGGFAELDDHLRTAETLSARSYPRSELAARLTEENRRLGADRDALESVARLTDANTFAIVAGQQAGIYGGPLFTLYKAWTAISVARRLTEQSRGRFRFVPLFWTASEDHDLDEITTVELPGADAPKRERAPIESDGRAAHDVLVDDSFLVFQEHLREQLPASDFRDDTFERIGARAGESLADWFSRTMLATFPATGLAIVDPRWIRSASAPVFERVIREHEAIDAALAEGQARVAHAGYEPILDRSGSLHLFRTIDGKRTRLEVDGDRITAPTGATWSRDELVEQVRARPEEFSSDVVTRPLVQSHVLPVPTFVGGPSEIAYFAELRDVFAHMGIVMPRLFPRASATLVTERQIATARGFGLDGPALFTMSETAPLSDELPDDVREPLEHLRRATNESLARIAESAGSIDAGLPRSIEKIAEQIRTRVDKVERAVHDGAERVAGRGRDRWARLRAELLPRGRLQERVYGPLALRARFGDGLASSVTEGLDAFDFRHQFVTLRPGTPLEGAAS